MTRLILHFGGPQTAGILKYFEDLRPTNKIKFDGSSRNAGNRAPNAEIGPKDFFEIASNNGRDQDLLPRIMPFKFAIIGGGLTATAMLCQLVSRVQEKAEKGQLNPSKLGIQIYEKQDTFGPGFPHSDKFTLPFHITNMCASDMGILEGKPSDFQEWVLKNSAKLQKRFSYFRDSSFEPDGSGQDCNHYPRAIMGAYLQTRFTETVKLAQKAGIGVDLYPTSEVVDLKKGSDGIRLSIINIPSGDLFFSDVNRVLLATGHWFEKYDQEHYFTSPWPAEKLLREIPPHSTVAVIGTSLSAIETLLTLTSEGRFIRSDSGELIYIPSDNPRKFVLYSRRGLLPKVRGKMGSYRNRFLNRENLDRLLSGNRGNLTMEPIFRLLNSELETAYGRTIDWEEVLNPTGRPADLLQRYLDDSLKGDGPNGELIWQTVLHQSFDMVRDIYLNLTLEERRRFDQNYTSVFFTHAATQPAINAEKLLALIKADLVEVIKLGNNYQLVKNEVNDYYELTYRDDSGNLKQDAYRYVVNARGQEKSLETNPSALARNLIKSGTAKIEEFRPVGRSARPGDQISPGSEITGETYHTGSIWIDPETHTIMHMGPDNEPTKSSTIYAVGAMTRGQIIDASMARGIVRATSRIADDMVDYLIRTFTK